MITKSEYRIFYSDVPDDAKLDFLIQEAVDKVKDYLEFDILDTASKTEQVKVGSDGILWIKRRPLIEVQDLKDKDGITIQWELVDGSGVSVGLEYKLKPVTLIYRAGLVSVPNAGKKAVADFIHSKLSYIDRKAVSQRKVGEISETTNDFDPMKLLIAYFSRYKGIKA